MSDTTISIVLVLVVVIDWTSYWYNINYVLLMGKFKNGEELCMKVSEEFEDKYKVGVLLKLRKKIY